MQHQPCPTRSFKHEAAAISFVQALSAAARAKGPDARPLPLDAASTDAEAPPSPEGPTQKPQGGGANSNSSRSNGENPGEGGEREAGSKGKDKASGKFYAVSVGRTVGLQGGLGAMLTLAAQTCCSGMSSPPVACLSVLSVMTIGYFGKVTGTNYESLMCRWACSPRGRRHARPWTATRGPFSSGYHHLHAHVPHAPVMNDI